MINQNNMKGLAAAIIIGINNLSFASSLLNNTDKDIVVNGHILKAQKKMEMPVVGGAYYQLDTTSGKSLGLFTINPNYPLLIKKPTTSIFKCGSTKWIFGYPRTDYESVAVGCYHDTIIICKYGEVNAI